MLDCFSALRIDRIFVCFFKWSYVIAAEVNNAENN